MPLLLLVFGALILVSAVRGTASDFFALLRDDVPPFGKWAGAIVAIGLLGYVPELRTASRILLGIVAFVVVASNRGAFAQFQQAFANPPPPTRAQADSTDIGPVPVKVDTTGGSAASIASLFTQMPSAGTGGIGF